MVPANPQLYDSISMRQRAIHHASGHMNFAAAGGIKDEYARLGGSYVDSKKDVDPRFRDKKKEEEDKKKRKEKERKAKSFV